MSKVDLLKLAEAARLAEKAYDDAGGSSRPKHDSVEEQVASDIRHERARQAWESARFAYDGALMRHVFRSKQ